MSEENVEVVRRFFEEVLSFGPLTEWGDAERATFERWTTPDVVYREDPRWPGADNFRGREEVLGAFRRYAEVFPDMSSELQDVRGNADAVVALVRFQGRAVASGIPTTHRWAYLVHVDGDRVASVRAYWEPAEALEVAGLSE